MSAPQHHVRAAMAEMWTRFRDSIFGRLEVLEEAVASALEGQLSAERRREAEREAHKLAGSIGTFGFVKASRCAREMEQILEGSAPPAPSEAARLAALVVEIRRELERASTNPEPAEAPASPETGPGSVLLVSGDTGFSERLMIAAAARGIRVETIADILRVEPLLSRKNLCMVLLDIDTAPNSTRALELIGELATRSPAIPTVVLADSGAFTDRIHAMRRGAAAFLHKPSSPEEVLDVVARYVDDSETRGLRLLALDDDPHLLAALRGMLVPAGIQLTTESDPLRFWEVLEEAAPDLLILDLDLPHVSGIEICRMIRSDRRWSGLPILFLTARTDAEAVRTIFAAGADDYLAKPVTGPELLTRIHERWKRMRLDSRPAGVPVSPGDGAELHRLDPAADGDLADAANVDVLVVEDDETLGTLLIHSLEARGYTTQWMQDGEAASEALGGEDPAVRARVVLLDVDLPGLNGLALLRQLMRDGVGRHTRFIMLTMRSEEREVVQALEIGAFDHVAKPFSVPVLMQRIRRALEA